MDEELFERVTSLRIIICRECQHGVRPAEVERHLKEKHRFPHRAATQASHTVRQWTDIEQSSPAIQIPRALEKPLPILPCEPSGLLCRRRDPPCQYLASSMDSMRKHWRQVHHWAQQTRRGRAGPAERARGEAALQRSFPTASWQRVFPSGTGSHYVHIRCPDGRQAPPPRADQVQMAADAIVAAWEDAQAAHEAQAATHAEELTDANPWLRMTGWARYLDGVKPTDKLRLVAAPDEQPREPSEPAVRTIWDAMDQLARRSQRTVQRCGVGIRVEAARTEAGQTPYRPLQAYIG